MEILLHSLRTHCAELALSDTGSRFQAFLCKLKRKKYEPMASWGARYRNENIKVRRALVRLHWAEEVLEWDGHSEGGASA